MVNRLNFFEKMLFLAGIAVTMMGFFYINKLYTGEGHLSWALLQAAFLWMVLIFLIILTDSNESVKEELKEVINQHVNETRTIKEVSKQQLKELEEIKELLSGKKKKR
jgi:Ca2+/Na+ antiporter